MLRCLFDPTARVSCDVTIGNEHREAGGVGAGRSIDKLIGHVGDGTVNVRPFAQVLVFGQFNFQLLDKSILTVEVTDVFIVLGEVKTSHRPVDINCISVCKIL